MIRWIMRIMRTIRMMSAVSIGAASLPSHLLYLGWSAARNAARICNFLRCSVLDLHLDASLREMRARTDTAPHQDHRTLQRPGRHNDLPRSDDKSLAVTAGLYNQITKKGQR